MSDAAKTNSNQPVIFIFTKDRELLAFNSVAEAETYLEPWVDDDEVRHVYDATGRVYAFEREWMFRYFPAEPPRTELDVLVWRLKRVALSYAADRPNQVDRKWVRAASADEIIAWATTKFVTSRGSGRSFEKAIVSFLRKILFLN